MKISLEELENNVKIITKEILAKVEMPDDSILKITKALNLSDAGVNASRAKDVTLAIAYFIAAIKINPKCKFAYYNLAREYIHLGEELHKPYMGKATVEDSKKFYFKLASRVEFYEKGIENLKKVLKIDPTHAKSWYLLGMTYYYMFDYESARQAFQKAIEVDVDGTDGKLARDGLNILEQTERKKL